MLCYKSECALPFSKFLDSLPKMFTIFYEEGEPLTEHAKVSKLLTKVQHPTLTTAIAQLHFQLNTKGVTFMVMVNHLNTAISQTPDKQMAHQIKSTNTSNHEGRSNNSGGCGGGQFSNSECGGCGGGHGHGYNCTPNNKPKPNASTFYPLAEWNKLSYEECDKIHKENDKKDEQGDMKRTIGDISVEHVNTTISAMHQAQSAMNMDDTETTPNTQGGTAFGGKASTKKTQAIE